MSSESVPYVSVSFLQNLFERHGKKPAKHLGQHFLIDHNIVGIIIDAASSDLKACGELWACDIGAGPGVLTLPLAHKYRKVVAVEIDRGLQPIFGEVLQGYDNVELVVDDARKLKWHELIPDQEEIVVFGNLPYSAGPPIINNLLTSDINWRSGVFMLQREVAQRLTSEPGNKSYGTLTLAIRFWAEVKMVHQVSPSCFWPPPEVHSSIVKMSPRKPLPGVEFEHFISLVRAAFNWRRKTIRNALSQAQTPNLTKAEIDRMLQACEIDPRIRGESLDMDKYMELAREYENNFKE